VKLRVLILLLSLMPAALIAQEVLSPEEFEAYSEGKTLYFALRGEPFGVEQYLPNRRAIWQYADGSCVKGYWYARRELICFIYDGDSRVQCWNFLKKGEGFAARSEGADPSDDLDVIRRDEKPITCLGPDVGA
jgi:hypothetical protein